MAGLVPRPGVSTQPPPELVVPGWLAVRGGGRRERLRPGRCQQPGHGHRPGSGQWRRRGRGGRKCKSRGHPSGDSGGGETGQSLTHQWGQSRSDHAQCAQTRGARQRRAWRGGAAPDIRNGSDINGRCLLNVKRITSGRAKEARKLATGCAYEQAPGDQAKNAGADRRRGMTSNASDECGAKAQPLISLLRLAFAHVRRTANDAMPSPRTAAAALLITGRMREGRLRRTSG